MEFSEKFGHKCVKRLWHDNKSDEGDGESTQCTAKGELPNGRERGVLKRGIDVGKTKSAVGTASGGGAQNETDEALTQEQPWPEEAVFSSIIEGDGRSLKAHANDGSQGESRDAIQMGETRIDRNGQAGDECRDDHRAKGVLCGIIGSDGDHLYGPENDGDGEDLKDTGRHVRILCAERASFVHQRDHGACKHDKDTDQDA